MALKITAEERAEEEANARNDATEAVQIATNRQISSRRGRELADDSLAKMSGNVDMFYVFRTAHRKRWYKRLRRAPNLRAAAVAIGLSERWEALSAADRALWYSERDRWKRRQRRIKLSRTIHNVPEPFWSDGHSVSHGARQWLPQKILGQGGHGAAVLYVMTDDDERALDHGVLKVSNNYHQQGGLGALKHPRNEIHYLREACNKAPRYVAEFRAAMTDGRIPPDRFYIFMTYYKYGDLSDLIRIYQDTEQQERNQVPDHPPEYFVWHVLHSLAQAGLALQDLRRGPPAQHYNTAAGLTQITAQPVASTSNIDVPDRTRLMHLDIKPQNVLLGASHGQSLEDFGEYPSVALGDFGLAMPPCQLSFWAGTPGSLPPECKYGDTPNQKADVWAVGLTAQCLMNNQRPARGLRWEAGNPSSSKDVIDATQHEWRPHTTVSYSKTLRRTVRRKAQRYELTHRLTFRKLVKICEEELKSINEIRTQWRCQESLVWNIPEQAKLRFGFGTHHALEQI